MTPLRKRMLEDMQLKGYAPSTQSAYAFAVRRLAKHYHSSPDLITEEELRAYLLDMQKQVAHRTFQITLAALRFLFDGRRSTEMPSFDDRQQNTVGNF